MSTRRVTRSATGALSERDKNTNISSDTNIEVPNAGAGAIPKSGRTKKRTAGAKAESAPKRKKAASSAAKSANEPKATIAKRGWTLPHGMSTGELTSNDDAASSGQIAASSSSTTDVASENEQNATPQQSAESNSGPMPDNVSLPAQDVKDAVNDPAATKTGTEEHSKRPSRKAAMNIKYFDDVPMSDDTNITATDNRANNKVEAKRSARRATKKNQSEATNDNTEPKTEDDDVVAQVPDPDFKPRMKRGEANKYGLTRGYSPYPNRTVPTAKDCEEVHRILVETHGAVIQPRKIPPPSIEVTGCGEVPSVLDALLRTRISANTLMENSDRAIQELAKTYGLVTQGPGTGSINWNAVRLESEEKLANTIRPAGTPKLKAGHIKQILDMVHEEQKARAHALIEGAPVPGAQNEDDGQKALEISKALDDDLSLEHMRAMTADEAIDAFVKYPGIAVKTAACVVLFCLQMPCLAVDTHVHKMSKWLGWVPEKANETDTFNHLEHTCPDHLKYAMHQLFIRHGQDCFKCRKNTKPGTKAWAKAPDCPLEHLLNRNKEFAKGGAEDDDEEEVSGDDDGNEDKKPKRTKGKKQAVSVEEEDAVAVEDELGSKPAPKKKAKRTSPKKKAITAKNKEAAAAENKVANDDNDAEKDNKTRKAAKKGKKVKEEEEETKHDATFGLSDAESDGVVGDTATAETDDKGTITKKPIKITVMNQAQGPVGTNSAPNQVAVCTKGEDLVDETLEHAVEDGEEGSASVAEALPRRNLRSRGGV